MRLLLTGTPGIGKTTVVRAVVENLGDLNCAGFYTLEQRRGGRRIGFKIVTVDGQEGILASIDRGRAPTVGKYTVHVEEFERLALGEIDPERNPADLYVIDEIGKMELCSQKFRNRIIDFLARPSNLLATIAKRGKGFVEQIKGRNDIELIEVTVKNRDELPRSICEKIAQSLK